MVLRFLFIHLVGIAILLSFLLSQMERVGDELGRKG